MITPKTRYPKDIASAKHTACRPLLHRTVHPAARPRESAAPKGGPATTSHLFADRKGAVHLPAAQTCVRCSSESITPPHRKRSHFKSKRIAMETRRSPKLRASVRIRMGVRERSPDQASARGSPSWRCPEATRTRPSRSRLFHLQHPGGERQAQRVEIPEGPWR